MILRVLWTSVAATVLVAGVFSMAIRCVVRSSEMRLEGRRGAAAVYGSLAGVAFIVFGAAVVSGLLLMAHKS